LVPEGNSRDKNADLVKEFLARSGIDYTMYDCEGSWKGLCEKSMLFELDGSSREVAEAIAQFIKDANVQEAVMIQEIPVNSRLV